MLSRFRSSITFSSLNDIAQDVSCLRNPCALRIPLLVRRSYSLPLNSLLLLLCGIVRPLQTNGEKEKMAILDKVQAQIAKLQAQAEALVAKQSSGVIAKIRDIMEKHGLTTADVEANVR